MTTRDDLVSTSTSREPATQTTVQAERATPQPTVLSTVWEGPPNGRSTGGTEEDARPFDRQAGDSGPRILRWLFAPATHRRAMIITASAALVCGGIFAVGRADERGADRPATSPPEAVESTSGSLNSQAVATDPIDQTVAEAPTVVEPVAEPDSIGWEAVSADERLRLTASSLPEAADGWMLEAQVVDPAQNAPVVRFTVNGIAVEEIERSPYRLVLSPELLTSFPTVVGDGQPLIVTASALWPGVGETASPATLVLPN